MQKGPHIALQALSKLLDYSWKLDIVGEGELERPLKVLVKQLGLKNRVSFYGPTRNISHLFAAHDIVLMPSLWEGLGMVAMEAMAAGRVVVASNVGGLPEIITDNETGFLVPPSDPKLFAEKLRWCFNNAEQCRVVAEGARAYAAEHFKAEVMAAGYAVHYEALRRK
jgi:glycosyltransferase involved in cell wall biosynthesis